MARIRVRDIILQECLRTGMPLEVLAGPSRDRDVAHARQYAMWRCRRETAASLKQIALCFGRDHTTVVHAVKKIESMAPEERMFAPHNSEMPHVDPLVIDISDLRERVVELSKPKPAATVFPIRPIYKVA